jgi:4-amino-4-deoxy-L-arabinose transferase-like glycosyltransferase
MVKKIVVAIIALITIATRFIYLETVPGFMTYDEIAVAYNAYSLARTGKDEYGYPWPVVFKSNDDYKAPGYMYVLGPLTLIMPHDKTTARIPSALAGSLTVLVAGLLFFVLTNNFWLASLGSLLLAITPWHIASSRMALEANLALFFLTLGLWLWLKKRQLLSAVIFAASAYSYHTEKLFIPLLIWISQWKKWAKYWKFWSLFLILMLPGLANYIGQMVSGAPSQAKWFWDHSQFQILLNDPKMTVWLKIMHFSRAFIENYGSYFNPGYLFVNGLTLFQNNSFIQSGLLLLPEFILIIIGLVKIKKYILRDYQGWVIWWLILLPVVPALTIDNPNLNRSLVAVVPLSLIAAMGLYWVMVEIKNKWIGRITTGAILLSFIFFVILYFGVYRVESKENFQWGYEQIGRLINDKYYNLYDKIVADYRFGETNRYIGAPKPFIAYFTGRDPLINQEAYGPNGPAPSDKYIITSINWNLENTPGKVLYITPRDNLPENRAYVTIEEIRLGNTVEFKLIELEK